FEPDHLAAVSTLATRPAARLWSAARLGLIWGLGHTVTVGAVALLIIVLGVRLPDRFWPAAELLVAGLLILLGAVVIWRYVRGHDRRHAWRIAHTVGARAICRRPRRAVGGDSACGGSGGERGGGRRPRAAGDRRAVAIMTFRAAGAAEGV